jgi:hypothetical protein
MILSLGSSPWGWRLVHLIIHDIFVSLSPNSPPPSGPVPHYRAFKITLRHTTLGRTPLDEWSARCKDLYNTHTTHKMQTSMPPTGFKPTMPASERPQTHASDRAVNGISSWYIHRHCKTRENANTNLECFLSSGLEVSDFMRVAATSSWGSWTLTMVAKPTKCRVSPKDTASYCKIPEASAIPVWQPSIWY